MAKFKIGDKVKILAGSKTGRIGVVESSMPGPQGGEMYHIRLDDGILTDLAERNLILSNSAPVRSANAVVQNAINARRARNGDILDRSFVKQKASSIYNDLDDLLDYVRRAAKNESNIRIESSIANSMNALRGII